MKSDSLVAISNKSRISIKGDNHYEYFVKQDDPFYDMGSYVSNVCEEGKLKRANKDNKIIDTKSGDERILRISQIIS